MVVVFDVPYRRSFYGGGHKLPVAVTLRDDSTILASGTAGAALQRFCVTASKPKNRQLIVVQAIVIDLHAEATSEKMAMGHVVDGRVSLCVGTHTHVPTADTMILPGGTAYQSAAGMCGDYDSVIGMKKEGSIERFRKKIPGPRLEAAQGPATLCAVFIETDDETGLATRIAPLRMGGRLSPARPDIEGA